MPNWYNCPNFMNFCSYYLSKATLRHRLYLQQHRKIEATEFQNVYKKIPRIQWKLQRSVAKKNQVPHSQYLNQLVKSIQLLLIPQTISKFLLNKFSFEFL